MASNKDSLSSNPVVRPFQEFVQLEAAGGILLLICSVLALVWANSPLAPSYFEASNTTVSVGIGGFEISKPALLWINDGLMAIFFFVVGLEIKREILTGELSSPKNAALALVAAAGGMLVPALVYAGVNWTSDGISGWGIPMATDIAFALGVLALLGKRVPIALKVFLTALAIVDDLGAVLVIAVFYTTKVNVGFLAMAAVVFAALIVVNRSGVRRTSVYVVLGILLWVAFLKSGVHATIAGVLLALTIPATRLIDGRSFLETGQALLNRFGKDLEPGRVHPSSDQMNAIHAIEETAEKLDTPLHRMEHALHGWVAFFIMPLFALANAGVVLNGDMGLTDPVTLGVIAGLFIGKQFGITLFAWLSVKLGWAALPAGVSWKQIYGVSLLCGIGFTMSLFIANLAFQDLALLDSAKIGILLASVISGLVGFFILRSTKAVANDQISA